MAAQIFFLLTVIARTSATAESTCSSGCANNGTCNEELGRCDCPRHRSGAACEIDHAADEAGAKEVCKKYSFIDINLCMDTMSSRGACLNDCNGRGTCVGGWCHCRPPYYGADCCLSMTSGKPVLLEGLNYTENARLPRVVRGGASRACSYQ
jgi:hypothetical protein